MPDLLSGNAVIGQSGGPTAVINQSLAGVVEGLALRARRLGQGRAHLRHAPRRARAGEAGRRGAARSHADRQGQARCGRAHALRRARLDPRQAGRGLLREDPRRLPPQRHPLFLLYRRQRFGRHLPHRQREGGRGRLRASLLSCAEDDRQRSPGERPHAGFPVRGALCQPRADGGRARQCEPRRHQDQRHHGAERGLSRRRRRRSRGERRPTAPRRRTVPRRI